MAKFTAAEMTGAFNDMLATYDHDTFWDDGSDLIREEMAYEGFDPKLIYLLVTKKKGTALRTKEEDICTMIALCGERGNKVSKIIERSSDAFSAKVKKLRDVYGLKDTAKGKREVITLARVSLAFPLITCAGMIKTISPTVPFEILDAKIQGSYPRQMTTAAFSGLIPTLVNSIETTKLIKAHSLHQYHFGRTINPEIRGPPTAEEMMAIGNFVTAGVNSTFVPQAARLKCMFAWGLISIGDDSAVVTAEVAKAAAVFINLTASLFLTT